MPLYPAIEPYASGHLDVGDGQQVWWEESGNPDGKPAVFLHGGPGGGISPGVRRLFDPERYRVVLLDQRGCGRSLPHASTPAYDPALNTTWHLVADLERIREARGIERWQVFGGSWGSALALAYAETHPERVTELVLRGIFTLRRSELDFFYGGGAGQLVPELYAGYLAPLLERGLVEVRPGGQVVGDPIAAYHVLLFDPDPAVHGPAAVAWATYEASTITLVPDAALVAEFADPSYALAFARIENDYFVHAGWFATTAAGEGQLVADADRLADIPGVIVQGRYDLCTPAVTAWDLHRAWPLADYVTAPTSGHAWTETEITEALVAATDRFAGKIPAAFVAPRRMDSLADRTIALFRTDHDDLSRLVSTLTPDQLAGGSGAAEWNVAQVLSHLGSGAEITSAALEAATSGADTRDDGFNQRVWDRWNALAPAEQAAGAVESDERLVAALEALSPEQRDQLRVAVGFLPEPVDLTTFLGTRLDEFVQHSWDVRVAVDPDAGLSPTGAELLAEHLSGDLGFFLGFIGRPEALGTPAVVEIDGSGYSFVVADAVRLVADSADRPAATATFVGPLEAALRLVTGRLTPARTPEGTTVTGNVTLDDLRRVFPGF